MFKQNPSVSKKITTRIGLRRGSALIEAAIGLPVLIVIAIIAADFGRIYFTGIAVANAARSAAEYGAQSVSNSTDTALINQAGRDDGADARNITVTSTRFCKCPDGSTPDCTGTCGNPYPEPEVFVKANASSTITLVFGYPGIPRTLTYRDSAVFRAQ